MRIAPKGRRKSRSAEGSHRRNGGSANQAKAICAACPVRLQCLVSAIDGTSAPPGTPALVGVWGGLSIENAGRARLPSAWRAKQCDGLIPLSEPGCGCRWCVMVRRHFASLPTIGKAIRKAGLASYGNGAKCGTASKYGRGRRCDPCSAAQIRHESKRKLVRRAKANASRGRILPPGTVAA